MNKSFWRVKYFLMNYWHLAALVIAVSGSVRNLINLSFRWRHWWVLRRVHRPVHPGEEPVLRGHKATGPVRGPSLTHRPGQIPSRDRGNYCLYFFLSDFLFFSLSLSLSVSLCLSLSLSLLCFNLLCFQQLLKLVGGEDSSGEDTFAPS